MLAAKSAQNPAPALALAGERIGRRQLPVLPCAENGSGGAPASADHEFVGPRPGSRAVRRGADREITIEADSGPLGGRAAARPVDDRRAIGRTARRRPCRRLGLRARARSRAARSRAASGASLRRASLLGDRLEDREAPQGFAARSARNGRGRRTNGSLGWRRAARSNAAKRALNSSCLSRQTAG